MTDRELLEAAAKAAGINAVREFAFQHDGSSSGECKHGLWNRDDGGVWNPLTDDGDALRLAVKLRINVEHMKTMHGKEFGVNCWPTGRGDCGVTEDGDLADYAAATRRAIVRAAAAIGMVDGDSR